jgi:bifunctional non-homologous end joining protein LigD
MGLSEYKKKRRFNVTPEPGPEEKQSELGNIFVVQKHRATQLHYDFRLEADGVLKSWAVPKGPSMDPTVKRLAMQVEDHPVDYADFEGVIPEGEYGGGTVMVWDYGVYAPENVKKVSDGLKKGDLKFVLLGKKLKGSFVLVRTGGSRQWLLIKHKDEYAREDEEIAETQPYSVLTKRTLAEIAADEGGVVEKAATGDPKKLPRRTGTKRRKKQAKKKVWHSNR